MSRDSLLVLLASFALTYLAHSTALFALVWLLERVARLRALAVREALWRAVLFAAPFTAAWQFAAPRSLAGEPWLGRLALPLVEDATGVETVPASTAGSFLPHASVLEVSLPSVDPEARGGVHGFVLPAPVVSPETRSPSGPRFHFNFDALSPRTCALLVAATLLALVLLVPALQLRLWLGRRTRITEGGLCAELRALCQHAGVHRTIRLTTSHRIAGPIAFGLFRPEICLPSRALGALEPDLARAMLAHELMHLARLDPLWLALGELARRLLFFQPLAAAAHRRLVHLAELACDLGAVRLTGDRLALARSLTEVATWIQGRRPKALCAMARTPSQLEVRVHRLLDPREERERRSWRLAAPMVVAGAALALPTLAFERARLQPSQPLQRLQHDQVELEESLAGLRASLDELSSHALTQEEEARALELSSRVLELSHLLSQLDVQITEHARRAPFVPEGP